jgi:HK97 family phage major capsid protein
VFVRQRANVLPPLTSAQSLGAVSLDTDIADSAWTAELAIGTADSSIALGKRELNPHALAKYIKISNTLLRRASQSAEALVTDRLGYKMAITQENAFLNGGGSGQPLGAFTASDLGVPTSRDVSTDNTTTAITFDGLQNAKYTLKSQYWGKASWTFHRDAIKQLAKIKDGDGRYIWEQSVTVGAPDRLLGFPMDVSEYAPNTFTTGLYVGLLCDWSQYWIVDSLGMSIQRLVELYAATNQTGFISRTETDGMPVLAEAFVRVKLA